IEKLAAGNGPVAGRVAAIYTLKLLRASRADEALAKLAADPAVKEQALRALADRAGDTGVSAKPFVDALADANPRVRLAAAWGLGRLGRPETAAALVPLAADADYLVSHVAINSLVRLKAIEPLLKAVDSANPKLAAGALKALQQIHEPAVVDGLSGTLGAIQDAELRGQVFGAIARLYNGEADWTVSSWWGARPDTPGPYFKTAEWAGTEKVKQILKTGLTGEKGAVLKALVLEMQRTRVNIPELSDVVAKVAGF